MVKNSEMKWRSKVTEGLRIKIPKEIAEMYSVEKDNIVEWKFDEKGSIRIEIKEMVLKEKKAKVKDVEGAKVQKDKGAKVKRNKDIKVGEIPL